MDSGRGRHLRNRVWKAKLGFLNFPPCFSHKNSNRIPSKILHLLWSDKNKKNLRQNEAYLRTVGRHGAANGTGTGTDHPLLRLLDVEQAIEHVTDLLLISSPTTTLTATTSTAASVVSTNGGHLLVDGKVQCFPKQSPVPLSKVMPTCLAGSLRWLARSECRLFFCLLAILVFNFPFRIRNVRRFAVTFGTAGRPELHFDRTPRHIRSSLMRDVGEKIGKHVQQLAVGRSLVRNYLRLASLRR